MPKYKAKNKDAYLHVKVKLLRHESLAERDLSMMAQRRVRGLLKPNIIKPNVLEYTGPQAIALSEFFKKRSGSYEFFYIMAQIIRLEKRMTANELMLKNLIVDPEHCFINEKTNELQFIYLPLTDSYMGVVVKDFLELIARNWNPCLEANMLYRQRFLDYLQNQSGYDPEAILETIRKMNHKVAEELDKTQTASGFITNKKAEYIKHYGKQAGSLPKKNAEETDLLPEESYSPGRYRGYPGKQSDPEETSLLDDRRSFAPGASYPYEDGTALLDGTPYYPGYDRNPDKSSEDTALLNENPQGSPSYDDSYGIEPETTLLDDGTSILDELSDYQDGTSLLVEETPATAGWGRVEPYSGGTELLDDEGTSVLEPVSASQPVYPYLIRRSTNERISVNKPVFRIGKERSYVDCFIGNNGAISRSHADIIARNTRYFICDRNSTNKTYRNGFMLTPEDEVEIFDGDILRLANEEFEFHIY